MAPASAVARRAFADARVRTISFALLFCLSVLAQVAGYRQAYPTAADRAQFARSFGDNDAVRLLYGTPHDLLTVGGYAAWRAGGILVVFAAVWALLGAVRAMRADEEAGRAELMLAGVVSRRAAYGAQLAAIGTGALVLWAAAWLGLLVGGLEAGASAYLALAIVSPVPVFAGVGALASQIAPTRRMATGLATAVLGIAFALRAVADSSGGIGWLRWATPLGWAEELRPFTGARPLALLVPVLAGGALLLAGGALAARRDVGRGLVAGRDSAPPRLRGLGSPAALAARDGRGVLAAWAAGVGSFAFLLGVLSDSVASGLSDSLRRQFEKLGSDSIATASGYLGFTFVFFVLAVSLFACMQVAALRREEADERLETLLALPVARRVWLAGRLLVAVAGVGALALTAGVLAWAGAATQRAGVSLADMLAAGANCLPAALLFLGLGVLAFAVAPRASAGIAYGLVGVAFLWNLFGALLGAPGWLLALSPFHDVGLLPGEPFDAVGAGAMLGLAAAVTAVAVRAFERRDLTGG
jgi:polyether ionophore transport system permease protein